MSLVRISLNSLSKLRIIHNNFEVGTQLRWKKTPKRKPRWLPMAQSKIFRINQHPYEPPDETQLRNDLLDEYYRKLESIRKQFKEEIDKKPSREQIILSLKEQEEAEFKLLLEENTRENERIRKIREETLAREFQEKQLEWLQMAESLQQQMREKKVVVEEMVRAEKAKSEGYITLEKLEQAIEKAIDSPINLNFSLNLDGTVNWEGKPSLEYEEDIYRRLQESQEA